MAKRKQSAGFKTVALMLHILTVILVIVVIAWLGTVMYHFAYKIFADESYYDTDGVDRTATIRVESDSSLMDIAEMLENDNLIADKWVFWFQVSFADAKDDIQAGSYKLSSEMNSTEIIAAITAVSEEEEETTSSTAGSADLLESSLSTDASGDSEESEDSGEADE